MPAVTTANFSYQAQSAEGRAFAGTLEAASVEDATRQLQSLQLRVVTIEPATRPIALRSAFRSDDFLAFNQQLAQLTAGGLPIERSLRLLAREQRNRRSRIAVEQIASELEKGTTLGAAFTAHRGSFPPLYRTLLDAGVRAGDLSGVLLNLGRHVETIQRLRAALWRAVTYPLTVLTALLFVLIFIWFFLMPQLASLAMGFQMVKSAWGGSYYEVVNSNGTTPPSPIFTAVQIISYGIMLLIVATLLTFAGLALLGRFSVGSRAVEPLTLRLPLVGPILRWNLIARWCDALHLAVQAGLDLPAAIGLARDAIDSPGLHHDSQLLIATVTAGQPVDHQESLKLLPPLVPTAIQMGIDKNDLPDAAAVLARMYQEQAEVRLVVLPLVLSPLLLMITAVCVGLAVAAALLPLIMTLRSMMG